MWQAILEGAGRRPHIDCEKFGGEVFLKEVKFCYDRSLARVDCDGVRSEGAEEGMVGTCLRWPSFIYPSSTFPRMWRQPEETRGLLLDDQSWFVIAISDTDIGIFVAVVMIVMIVIISLIVLCKTRAKEGTQHSF